MWVDGEEPLGRVQDADTAVAGASIPSQDYNHPLNELIDTLLS